MEWLLERETFCLLMFASVCALLLTGFPVAFSLAGASMIFAFIAYFVGIFDLSFLTAFPQRVFSVMTNEVLVAVPLFVFMGVMLERSKVAEELLDNMGRLFGSMRGGLGYSVCIVGALLAASTGIVGATVVTMGLLSLPTMLRRGYDPKLACGSIAASGTLGQIIPPSIVLVLLGDQLSVAYQNAQFEQGIFAPDTVSVNDLFAGALFPGLMLVGMYILYQVFVAVTRPEASPAIPADELGGEMSRGEFARAMLNSLAPPLILIIAVLGSILTGLASPTEAAGVGALGAILLAGHRIDPSRGRLIALGAAALIAMLALTIFFDLRTARDEITAGERVAIWVAFGLAALFAVGVVIALMRVMEARDDQGTPVLASVARSATVITSMVFVILVGASMFSLVFRGLGGDEMIEEFLHSLPGGTLGAMITVMLVMFLLGFFLDFLEIVFIVVPIVSPILLQMEMGGELMNPVWLGVMMAVNLQTSFLTPPFGFALFYLRGVAPDEVTTPMIYRGVLPFVFIQLLGLCVLALFPAIATWLPTAIFGP